MPLAPPRVLQYWAVLLPDAMTVKIDSVRVIEYRAVKSSLSVVEAHGAVVNSG